jgi:hypothetical protein
VVVPDNNLHSNLQQPCKRREPVGRSHFFQRAVFFCKVTLSWRVIPNKSDDDDGATWSECMQAEQQLACIFGNSLINESQEQK